MFTDRNKQLVQEIGALLMELCIDFDVSVNHHSDGYASASFVLYDRMHNQLADALVDETFSSGRVIETSEIGRTSYASIFTGKYKLDYDVDDVDRVTVDEFRQQLFYACQKYPYLLGRSFRE